MNTIKMPAKNKVSVKKEIPLKNTYTKKYNNNIEKYKTINEMEAVIHVNDESDLSDKKTAVSVLFKGVHYSAKHTKAEIEKVLKQAIEKYLNPLKKISVQKFIEFVNKTYNVKILNIESINISKVIQLEKEKQTTKKQQKKMEFIQKKY